MEPLFWKPYKMICLINFVFGLLKTSSVGMKINSWLHFLRNVSNNKNALFHFWKRWVHCESCLQIIILIAAAFTLQILWSASVRRKSFTRISAYCTTAAGSFRDEEVLWLHRSWRFMMILSEVKLQNPVWKPTLPQIEALTGGDTRTVRADDLLVEAV